MKELVIQVPMLPPPGLNPNRSSGRYWAVQVGAKKTFGEAVKYCAINARNLWEKITGEPWQTLVKARVQLIFEVNRRGPLPDGDNMMAAMKPGIDALTARVRGIDRKGNPIVGACILQDDSPKCVEWLPPLVVRAEQGLVRIVVRERA